MDLEKSNVLQEAKIFHHSPVNPKKCSAILARIICMLSQGQLLATAEATECFFAMTKLFQNQEASLRRMVYLTIKALADSAEDVIIVTSSLCKDMTNKDSKYSHFVQRNVLFKYHATLVSGLRPLELCAGSPRIL